jgi:hypothetical protein
MNSSFPGKGLNPDTRHTTTIGIPGNSEDLIYADNYFTFQINNMLIRP